jgi:hypothetical protein
MNFQNKANRRTVLKNAAMVVGGLFVSGKILGQTLPSMPPGTPSNPSLPNPNTPVFPNPAENPDNTGLYQRDYPARYSAGVYSGGTYSAGMYGTGYYGSGYYQTRYN